MRFGVPEVSRIFLGEVIIHRKKNLESLFIDAKLVRQGATLGVSLAFASSLTGEEVFHVKSSSILRRIFTRA